MNKLLISLLGITILILSCSKEPSAVKERILLTNSDGHDNIPLIEEANTSPQTRIIKISNSGFNPNVIRVKSGDKVIWRNVRTGYSNQVILRGTRQCVDIRSPTLRSGEEFSWTFNRLRDCIIIDAVRHRQTSEVIVE